MAAEVHFIYIGGGRDVIPRDATHVIIHPSVKVIPAWLFCGHQTIVEFVCHDDVEKIEAMAFYSCSRLRRVVIPGVKVVEGGAFDGCTALADIKCRKLERIEQWAFNNCKSLSSIDLPSAKIVTYSAFNNCQAMMEAKFGKNLESIQFSAFHDCRSLERITIPLKNVVITKLCDDIFVGCENLKRVDVVEQEVLDETIAALLLEEWANDVGGEIDSINRILPAAHAGVRGDGSVEKAQAIREWITRVLRKITDCKAQHRRLLKEAIAVLQIALPDEDVVRNNVVPFLALPLHKFDGEGEEDEESDSISGDNNIDDSH